jgi:carotenoid cleavage dioxygenase-like enzyme
MSTATQAPARKGFESLESETEVATLPLRGKLPEWLTGSLLRTGPAKWEVGERSMNHWFDGLAMLHRFSFGGGEVSYANRFLNTRAYRAAKETGRMGYSEFATDPCRSLFQRVTAIFSPKLSDNANVNLVELGERFISMTETPIPVEFDDRTLDTVGVAYKPPGILTTAHPHLDRATKGMLNYAAKLGPGRATASSCSSPARRSRRCSRRRRCASRVTCTRSGSRSAGSCWRSSPTSSTRATWR